MIKKITLLAASLLLVSTLTACNTVEGVGKDISATGRAVKGAFGGK